MKRVFENIEKNVFLDKAIFPNLELLKECISNIETQLEERPTIIVFDKICKQNRDVGFFSNDSKGYYYSQKLMASKPLSPALSELLLCINTMLGAKYNGILVNKYNDGNDYIGAHSDNEIDLDPIGVTCISYGSERNFRIRNKNDKKIVHEENTSHCSILHMGGKFQKFYTHEIPIQKKIKGTRFSFTFRKNTI